MSGSPYIRLGNIAATTGWLTGYVGGHTSVFVSGTFSGATVALQMRPDGGGTEQAVTGASYTADGGGNFYLPYGFEYRWTVAGGPPSVTCVLGSVEWKRGL